jgi:hypothetical protein
VPFPSLAVDVEIPSCAQQSCQEYLQAGIFCATATANAASLSSCFCSRLTWPTACTQACSQSADRSGVASWYWNLCPSAMDARLGQFGVNRIVSTARAVTTVDSWAVQTPALGAGGIYTGYNCFYSSTCVGLRTISSASATGAAPNGTATTGGQGGSHGRVVGITLGVILPLTLVVVLLLLAIKYGWCGCSFRWSCGLCHEPDPSDCEPSHEANPPKGGWRIPYRGRHQDFVDPVRVDDSPPLYSPRL